MLAHPAGERLVLVAQRAGSSLVHLLLLAQHRFDRAPELPRQREHFFGGRRVLQVLDDAGLDAALADELQRAAGLRALGAVVDRQAQRLSGLLLAATTAHTGAS